MTISINDISSYRKSLVKCEFVFQLSVLRVSIQTRVCRPVLRVHATSSSPSMARQLALNAQLIRALVGRVQLAVKSVSPFSARTMPVSMEDCVCPWVFNVIKHSVG